MQVENRQPNLSIYLLALILLLLPIDSALSGLIGNISLIDYIVVIFLVVHCVLNPNVIFKKGNVSIILLPLLYATISVVWSINRLSQSNIMYLSYFVLFTFLLNTKFTLSEKSLLSKAIFGSVFLLLLFTVVFGEFYHSRLSININGYIDPNYFCTGFVLIVAFLLWMIKSKTYRLISLICLLSLFTVVFLSGSRGSLLAISIEIICYILFLNRKNLIKIIPLIIAFLLVAMAVFMILPEELTNRFNLLDSIKTDGGSGRLVIWKNMFAIYQDGSLLTKVFGYGRESSTALYKELVGINYTPHNVYIKILLELGIVGLVLVVICIISVLRQTIKNNNSFLFAVLVGIGVGSFFLDMDNTRLIWFIILFLVKQDIVDVKFCKTGGKRKYVAKHSCAGL